MVNKESGHRLRHMSILFIYLELCLWCNHYNTGIPRCQPASEKSFIKKYCAKGIITMKNKRITSAALCALLLLLSVGCSESSDEPGNNLSNNSSSIGDTSETSITEQEHDDLPADLDYSGKTFEILTYLGGNLKETTGGNYYNLVVDKEDGDVLNDAGYKVTTAVEDRLGIDLVCTETSETTNVVPTLRKEYMSGDCKYNLVMPHTLEKFTPLITDNILFDFSDLRYVDLSKKYYNANAISSMTIAGKTYSVAGSYAMLPALPLSYLYNKKAAEDLGITGLYDLVREGVWTHDKFMEIIKDTYRDLDGDGKKSEGDFYGFSTIKTCLIYTYCGYGGETVIPVKDGFEFGFGSERSVRIMEKLVDLCKSQDAGYRDNWNIFFGGNSVFCLYASGSDKLRDLDFDFGIVPIPKLDETQENYMVFSHGGYTVVPANIEDPDMTGAVIEALYSTADKYMPQAIIDQYIEGKLLTDEDDIEMFRLLNSNDVRVYDLTRSIDPSGKIGSYAPIEKLIKKDSGDIMSEWASIQAGVTESFKEFYDSVANN